MTELELAIKDQKAAYFAYVMASPMGNFKLRERLNNINEEVRRLKRLVKE